MDPRHNALLKQFLLGSLIFVCLFSFSNRLLAGSGLSQRPDIQAFAKQMQAKHNYDEKELLALFDQIELRPSVITAMQRPYEAKPWHQYRQAFITQARISEGVAFYKKHEATLKKAEQQFGVPAEIITAIIGVETLYGKNTGNHPVFESLATLAFDYPPRSKFFSSELEHYLLLTKEQGFDPLALKGSYAGAMGGPQFIASSYRQYAVDYSGSGKKDLLNNWQDIIGSVANYFQKNGWKTAEPIVYTAKANNKNYAPLLSPKTNPSPKYSFAEIKKAGISTQATLADNTAVALIALEETQGESLWVALNNFYVITRYNHSNLYAMAVYELSEKIKAQLNVSSGIYESNRPYSS